jgi:hypothetical protein
MGRDKISRYVRGVVFPSPVHLKVLCDALKCDPEDLIPNRGVPETGEELPQVDVRDAGAGMTWLRVNKMVDWKTALNVLSALEGKEIKG